MKGSALDQNKREWIQLAGIVIAIRLDSKSSVALISSFFLFVYNYLWLVGF